MRYYIKICGRSELKNTHRALIFKPLWDIEQAFFFKEVKNIMTPNGRLIITTPNLDSKWIKYFGYSWHGWGIPEYHRFILSRKSFEILATKYGYRIADIFETGPIGKNGWKYVLGSYYRLSKNKREKLLKAPIGLLFYMYMLLNKTYYTDTLFVVMDRKCS
jgi:hypothetical protein